MVSVPNVQRTYSNIKEVFLPSPNNADFAF